MPKIKTRFECNACGYSTAKWLGKCPDCGAWNSFLELKDRPEPSDTRSIRPRAPSSNLKGNAAGTIQAGRPEAITSLSEAGPRARWATGIGELDRILGGGLVPGSVTLIGGDPGVGKSTLLLQVALALAIGGKKVLYASGEESQDQILGRAQRIGDLNDRLFLQSETDLSLIEEGLERSSPEVLVLDSVQTVFLPELSGSPGNLSQVREVAARLVVHAKATGRAVLLVGHVTKGGQLAGPKTLEHIVDTVIYFEGASQPPYRVLRGQKNRFGATGELGIFEMTGQGLKEVPEPSAMLLRDRPEARPGTVVTGCLEGSRSLLLEVQALAAPGFPGSVRRSALGVDSGRLAMLCAVLGKTGYDLSDKDLFVNVVGGVRITEPAADLAVCAAIVSSLHEKALPTDLLVLGEVGLTGEVRKVPHLGRRLEVAARHGFLRALVPRIATSDEVPAEMEVFECPSLEEALRDGLPI